MSPEGGILVIDGKGFSSIIEDNTVMIYDQECVITDANFY